MNSATEDAVLGLDEEQSTKKGPAERPEKDGSFDETVLEGYLIEDNQVSYVRNLVSNGMLITVTFGHVRSLPKS